MLGFGSVSEFPLSTLGGSAAPVDEGYTGATVSDLIPDEPSRAFNWVECLPVAIIAVAASIFLAAGYTEPAEAEELDSYVQQVIEAPAYDILPLTTTYAGQPKQEFLESFTSQDYWDEPPIESLSTDLPEEPGIEVYAYPLVAATQAPADYIYGWWTEPASEPAITQYSGGLYLIDPPHEGLPVAIVTDLPDEAPIDVYSHPLYATTQPVAVAEDNIYGWWTDPAPEAPAGRYGAVFITTTPPTDETAVVYLHFDDHDPSEWEWEESIWTADVIIDDAQPFLVELPDFEEPEEAAESFVSQTFEDAVVPPPVVVIDTHDGDYIKKRFRKEIDDRLRRKAQIIELYEELVELKPKSAEQVIAPFVASDIKAESANIDFDAILANLDRAEALYNALLRELQEIDDEDILLLL